MITERALLGLPLDDALLLLRANGFEASVIETVSKRGVENADDLRVIRCIAKADRVELIVSKFYTRI